VTYTVAITKQGQISIPAAIRDLLGFSKPGNALARVEGTRLILEPAKDIMSLAGTLHNKIKLPKGYDRLTTQQIIKQEKEAAIKGHTARYEKSLR
jgi:AbrB family looped-hinge helix DNA binding protein